jgi:hypothetical protein
MFQIWHDVSEKEKQGNPTKQNTEKETEEQCEQQWQLHHVQTPSIANI